MAGSHEHRRHAAVGMPRDSAVARIHVPEEDALLVFVRGRHLVDYESNVRVTIRLGIRRGGAALAVPGVGRRHDDEAVAGKMLHQPDRLNGEAPVSMREDDQGVVRPVRQRQIVLRSSRGHSDDTQE